MLVTRFVPMLECVLFLCMVDYSGKSYQYRVQRINELYDQYVVLGVPNRTIWKRHVYPEFRICERTFYNILKASFKFKDEKQLNLF